MNSFDFFPMGLLIIPIVIVILTLVFNLIIIRWVFRINRIVELLETIAHGQKNKKNLDTSKGSQSDFQKQSIEYMDT